jgi:hypothetical protein
MALNYSEKLKNPKWQRKRLEILQRDEFKCCYCDDTETELQVHHIKYIGEPWQANNDDLITLCKHCHTTVSLAKYLNPVKIKKHYQSDDSICMVVKEIEDGKIIITIFDLFQNGNLISIIAFNDNSQVLKTLNDFSNG